MLNNSIGTGSISTQKLKTGVRKEFKAQCWPRHGRVNGVPAEEIKINTFISLWIYHDATKWCPLTMVQSLCVLFCNNSKDFNNVAQLAAKAHVQPKTKKSDSSQPKAVALWSWGLQCFYCEATQLNCCSWVAYRIVHVLSATLICVHHNMLTLSCGKLWFKEWRNSFLLWLAHGDFFMIIIMIYYGQVWVQVHVLKSLARAKALPCNIHENQQNIRLRLTGAN